MGSRLRRGIVLLGLVVSLSAHAIALDVAGPLLASRTPDLRAMVADGNVRMLVPYNHTHYFIQDGRPRGATFELGEQFEKFLRKNYETPSTGVDIVYVPVARDELIDHLVAGHGDIAAAMLSVTPARLKQVDFSPPLWSGVHEYVVTGPGVQPLLGFEQLSGLKVWVRASSSYAESLRAVDAELARRGKQPVDVHDLDERLETEDALQMVEGGLYHATVADEPLARLWADIFPNLVVHDELPLRDDVEISWAFRKDSPEMAEALQRFVPTIKKGTLLGNVIAKRYLRTNKWARNALSGDEASRFHATIDLFEEYGGRYEFEELLLAAQGYQESGLDQSKRSRAGAIGVMQLLPSTARSREVGIPDIEKIEPNIHAGAKYMRWIADTFFADEAIDELNRHLFALAAYNAGPSRVSRLRRESAAKGYDPNEWFGNVEVVVRQQVGMEPVTYVRNVYKYYLAYERIQERREFRSRVRSDGGL